MEASSAAWLVAALMTAAGITLVGVWFAHTLAPPKVPIVDPGATSRTSDHEIRLVKLETKVKALSDEWENKLVQLDTLVRRIVRQKLIADKLAHTITESDAQEDGRPAQLEAPRTRADLYRTWKGRRTGSA